MYPVRSTPLTPLLLTCFCLGLFLSLVEHAFADEPNRVRLDGIEFNLQPGLTLERAVPKSLVKWPVVVDWDCDGRLVVVEAGGAFKPIVESNNKLLDKIVRLEDTDGDGIFDKRILAADKLPFTQGVLCLGKSILVAAPPCIWKLTDNDGDGYCENREIWFDGQTITGCANDLHGPHLGIDGWIYWCKGAKAEQTHELTDGSQLKDRAAHIFRRRLEGGAIESVMSGGMENLVEVAFTPTGDRFFSATFVQLPANGKRDGIGHALYGSVHGRKHAVVSAKQVIRTGPLMPVMTHLGPAAPSGLICLREDNQILLPNSNRPTSSVLVTAQFNLHRVSAHRLLPNGAGYRASDHVLLEGDQVDFHPTDILEDKSGDLLVVDTGGWYDLCCPTSRGDQKVANGGIYRLRRSETEEEELPGTSKSSKIDWDKVSPRKCIELLRDPRPWIRTRAVLRVGELGDPVVPEIVAALSGKQDLASRLDLIWALSHIGSDAALTIVHDVLSDGSKHLDQRLAACHILGLYRFAPAISTLQGLCGNLDIRLVRAAVEALGRIKNSDSTEILMQVASRTKSDAALQHTLIYALIEIGDKQKLQNYLGNKNSAATRAIALVALNALNDSTISSFALNAIHSDQPLLINTAVEILKQHPEWSPLAGKHFARLSAAALSTTATSKAGMKSKELAQDILKNLFRAWQSQSATRAFVAKQLLRDELSLEYKLELLDAWNGLELPRVFDRPLSRLLSRDADLVGRRLSSFKLSSKKNQRLVASIKNELDNLETDSYSKAGVFLTALPSDSGYSNDQIQTYLLRNDFYSLLSKTQIDKSIGQKILQRLVSVSPADLPDAVTTIIGAKEDELDLQLMQHLSTLPAAKMLDIGLLPSLYRDRSDPLRQAAAKLEEKLHSAPDDVAAEVQAKLASLPKGDAVRGLKIFRGSKANCVACHKLGHVGGEHGPELTKIGNTRTREALLESILFPNVRIEQGFRPLKILTVDGQVFNGLATRESGIVHLQTNGEKRISIPEDEIEQQQPGEVSIMPTGMLEQLTNQELADLLAVLKSAK